MPSQEEPLELPRVRAKGVLTLGLSRPAAARRLLESTPTKHDDMMERVMARDAPLATETGSAEHRTIP